MKLPKTKFNSSKMTKLELNNLMDHRCKIYDACEVLLGSHSALDQEWYISKQTYDELKGIMWAIGHARCYTPQEVK